jgi:hypothetical protein
MAGPWPALALLGYGWGAGCARLLDYPREQCVELFAFSGGESDQDCVIEPLERLIEFGEDFIAPCRELDDRATAVGSVASALDQLGVFEIVQDRYEVSGVDANELDQRLLGGRPSVPEMLQGEQLAGAHAEGSGCTFYLSPHRARQLRDEQARRRSGFDVGGRCRHGTSVEEQSQVVYK